MQTLDQVITDKKLEDTRPSQAVSVSQQVIAVNPNIGEQTERSISASDSLRILHTSINRFLVDISTVKKPAELDEFCKYLGDNSDNLLSENEISGLDFINALLRRVNYCLDADLSDKEAKEYSEALSKLRFFQKELWAFRNLILIGQDSKTGERFDPTTTIRNEVVTYQPEDIIELLAIRNTRSLKLILEERCEAFVLFLRNKNLGEQIKAFSVFQFDGIIDAIESINPRNLHAYIEHIKGFVEAALKAKTSEPILQDGISTFQFELEVLGRKCSKLIKTEA